MSELLKTKDFLKIEPSIKYKSNSDISGINVFLESIQKLISDFVLKDIQKEDLITTLQKKLPLIIYSPFEKPPFLLSFVTMCHGKNTQGAGRFIADMLCKWLIPSRQLEIVASRSLNFNFFNFPQHTFFVIEFFLHVSDEKELDLIKKNIKIFIYHLKLSILSSYKTRNIILTKKLSEEEKSALIQENISSLLKPKDFGAGKNIFDQIQNFIFNFSYEQNLSQIKKNLQRFMNKKLKLTDRSLFEEIYNIRLFFKDEFTSNRDSFYVSKIISFFYLLKKDLIQKITKSPKEKHISIKFVKSKLKDNTPILVVILFMNVVENERFENDHFLQAIKACISKAEYVKNSFIEDKNSSGNIAFFIEVKKENFSLEELKFFKKNIFMEVKDRIENFISSIFLPRNEEEVLKNIVLLSKQLKYVKDVPHLIINYDSQDSSDIIFSVILLRLLKEHSSSIEEIFSYSDTILKFSLEEVKIVGSLRKKYKKESNIFKVSLNKKPFYRKDFSLDLQNARQTVVSELLKVLGSFRDFNGGMISVQKKAFDSFQSSLNFSQRLLMQKFFYSIRPAIMQSVTNQTFLKELFLLFLQILSQEKIGNFSIKTLSRPDHFLIAVGSFQSSFIENLKNEIKRLKISSFNLIYSILTENNIFLVGYIIKCNDIQKHSFYYYYFLNAMNIWWNQYYFSGTLHGDIEKTMSLFTDLFLKFESKRTGNKKQLKISLKMDPLTLDPRKSGDLVSSSVLFMLYNGLTEFEKDGSITPCLCKSIKVSRDKRIYTFYLKKNIKWSDGTEIIAQDFENSWKRILDSSFPALCPHLFYIIKNAEDVFKKRLSLDEVGIVSKNDKTLQITLENPSPYFLSLTSFCVLFPVAKNADKFFEKGKVISSGPFTLKKWHKNTEIILEKNKYYWNKKAISFDSIHIRIIKDEKENLKMFKKGKIDWAGTLISPLPLSNISYFKNSAKTNKKTEQTITPIGGTTFCAFNIEKFPFNNKNIRKAFGLAINRKKIIKTTNQIEEQIATRCFPPIIMNNKNLNLIKDNDIQEAKKFFRKGLKNLKIKPHDIEIEFVYEDDKFYQIQAQIIKNTWEKIFNVKIHLKKFNSNTIKKILHTQQFQVSLAFWIVQYNDPMNLLERFKYKKHSKNYSNWENDKYKKLLDKANKLTNKKERLKILEEIEKIFIEDMPISPIYHHSYFTFKKSNIKGIFTGPVGEIHFDKAYVEKK